MQKCQRFFLFLVSVLSLYSCSMRNGGVAGIDNKLDSNGDQQFQTMAEYSTQTLNTEYVVLEYNNNDSSAEAYQVQPQFKIINNSQNDLELSKLKVRYYFTNPDDIVHNGNIDFSGVGVENTTLMFAQTGPEVYYLEFGFTGDAGSLGESCVTRIHARFGNENFSLMNQSDDYSFDSSITDFTPYGKMCIYYDGVLIWGTNADGESPDENEVAAIFGGAMDREAINGDDWLSTSGTKIIDASGNEVRLTGINYFGFETTKMVFQGLWASDLKENLDLMADLGFNLIRVPVSIELVSLWADGNPPMPDEGGINFYNMNEYLVDKNTQEVFDFTLDYCEQIGMKVMLDMHQVLKDRKRNLWYYDSYTVDDFYRCWEYLAERYKDNDTIIAMDLFNEPHGRPWQDDFAQEGAVAIWNNQDVPNNWKIVSERAAAKILAINPNVLIMIEGIHAYPKDPVNNDYILWNYEDKDEYHQNWWGGNLRGVALHPINLGAFQHKLVYEPHDYGPGVWPDHPWFEGEINYTTLFEECWQPNWFFIHEQNIAPLLIGEWGSIMHSAGDSIRDNEIRWFELMADFIVEHDLHYTYWCYNPNSGDTGGIVKGDWKTVEQEKYEVVKPTLWMDEYERPISLDHRIPLGQNGITVTEYYLTH